MCTITEMVSILFAISVAEAELRPGKWFVVTLRHISRKPETPSWARLRKRGFRTKKIKFIREHFKTCENVYAHLASMMIRAGYGYGANIFESILTRALECPDIGDRALGVLIENNIVGALAYVIRTRNPRIDGILSMYREYFDEYLMFRCFTRKEDAAGEYIADRINITRGTFENAITYRLLNAVEVLVRKVQVDDELVEFLKNELNNSPTCMREELLDIMRIMQEYCTSNSPINACDSENESETTSGPASEAESGD